MIGNITGAQQVPSPDKYLDNHYAVDLRGFNGTSIADWLEANKDDAFPIDWPRTYFAWVCTQSYIIDPTGWAIQDDYTITLPNCSASDHPGGSHHGGGNGSKGPKGDNVPPEGGPPLPRGGPMQRRRVL